jgi:acetoin utilization deacetylase AcuC-like enzyme
MNTLLYSDPRYLAHDPGPTHPESPSRLRAISAALDRPSLAGIRRLTPPSATATELARVHRGEHVERVLSLAGQRAQLDPDTVISPGSAEAALLAAGAAVDGVRRVLAGEATSAFALVRPPGHHAEAAKAMGFCLFNNVAVAAAEAHARGLSRVLCVDWDVHHGNGTQHSFYDRRELLFMSAHQFPFYPGTGDAHEIGSGEGEGHTVNVPLPAGCGGGDYAAAFTDLLLPIADAYRPELVLVSAGFDAHRDDPLGAMKLTEEDFAALCGAVKGIADRHCDGKMVLTLEGGYDLRGLAASVRACLEVLAGAAPPPLRPELSPRAKEPLERVAHVLRKHWPL